jgi:hypothetical protein
VFVVQRDKICTPKEVGTRIFLREYNDFFSFEKKGIKINQSSNISINLDL